jgi:WXG100 family type VII secretion target
MTARFVTHPNQMRSIAVLFEMYAQIVQDEARKMRASSQNIAGADWSGQAQVSSYHTMGQINQAFLDIVNMLYGARDDLIRDANIYEQQERDFQQTLGC